MMVGFNRIFHYFIRRILGCLHREIPNTQKESEKSRKPRDEVEAECFTVAHSAGDENSEIAKFMRQFVQKDGDGSRDSRFRGSGKGGREGDAVHEIVNTVAN